MATPDDDLPPELAQSFTATLRCANGTVASIIYAGSGDTRLPKERVEGYRGGVAVVLDDFGQLEIYAGGKKKRLSSRGATRATVRSSKTSSALPPASANRRRPSRILRPPERRSRSPSLSGSACRSTSLSGDVPAEVKRLSHRPRPRMFSRLRALQRDSSTQGSRMPARPRLRLRRSHSQTTTPALGWGLRPSQSPRTRVRSGRTSNRCPQSFLLHRSPVRDWHDGAKSTELLPPAEEGSRADRSLPSFALGDACGGCPRPAARSVLRVTLHNPGIRRHLTSPLPLIGRLTRWALRRFDVIVAVNPDVGSIVREQLGGV